MATTSPVRTSSTMPQAPMALKSPIALSSSSRTTACTRTSIDSFNARAVLGEPLLEEALDAGHATPVDIDAADHMRGDAAEREAALFGGLELDAGDAEGVDGELFARRDLPGDIDELPIVGCELALQLGRVQPQHGMSFDRGLVGVDQDLGVGEDAGGRQRHGEDFAVAGR
jgi:hypothetical protein